MKKIMIMIMLCCSLAACAPKKPPLAPTQIVDGKSIIIPPEFDTVPEVSTESQEKK